MKNFCINSKFGKHAALFLLLNTLLFPDEGHSMDLKPSEIRGKTTNNPVSVLQNRYFLKKGRPEVGLIVGTSLNESYTDTSMTGIRSSIFLNEWLGLEFQQINTKVKDSADRTALNMIKYRKLGTDEIVSPDPEVNKIHGITDANVIVAPFYAKMNLMDEVIIYSDIYMVAGISKVDTDQGNKTAMEIGGGERFYWEKSISFRVEYRDRIYTETRAGENSRKNAHSIDFGLSYFFM
ncbi:MAG: outer membrane beta-barrel domain-containing protein [Oligoflexales bacterium]|nr:outer membrane beta-barrel domain-containing protein [Oligoflexales bacterium]